MSKITRLVADIRYEYPKLASGAHVTYALRAALVELAVECGMARDNAHIATSADLIGIYATAKRSEAAGIRTAARVSPCGNAAPRQKTPAMVAQRTLSFQTLSMRHMAQYFSPAWHKRISTLLRPKPVSRTWNAGLTN